MNPRFQFTPLDTADVDYIWWFIAEHTGTLPTKWNPRSSVPAGGSLDTLTGTRRQDITPLPLRFWIVTKFPNYAIVYRPATVPLQVVAVLHSKRDLKEVLERRS